MNVYEVYDINGDYLQTIRDEKEAEKLQVAVHGYIMVVDDDEEMESKEANKEA